MNNLNFSFNTTISGLVIDTGKDYFVLKNLSGRFKIFTNVSTQIIIRNFEKLDEQTEKSHLLSDSQINLIKIGSIVTGTVVVYPEKANKMVCIKLIILDDSKNDNLVFENPNFWIEYVLKIQEFWKKHAIDKEYGGYFTNLSRNGEITQTDKHTYVISRIIYGFCTSFALTGNLEFLELAKHGVNFQLKHSLRKKGEYILWETHLNRDGSLHKSNPRFYNIFTQIYSLTGLISYYSVTHSKEIEEIIKKSIHTLNVLFKDNKFGGFFDSIDKSSLKPIKNLSDSKSFNSTIDVAISTLLPFFESCPKTSPEILGMLREIVQLILSHFIDKRTGWIREVFKRNWKFSNPNMHNPYSTPDKNIGIVGSNTKTAWLLLRMYDLVEKDYRKVVFSSANTILSNMSKKGYDSFRWGWFDVILRESDEFVWHQNKCWWAQEEGILGNFLYYLLTKNNIYRQIVNESIFFYLEYFIDKDYGGIFDTVDINGNAYNSSKANPLKGSYHEIEIAYYLYLYFSGLKNRPFKLYYKFKELPISLNCCLLRSLIPTKKIKAVKKKKANNIVCIEYNFSKDQ